MILFFYNLALLAVLVMGAPWWLWRIFTTKKYREGLWERLGRVRVPTGQGKRPLIWVHAVSVGEVLAVSRLVKALDAALPGHLVAVSTTTRTGQDLARERFGADRVFYCPLDLPWAVRAYLNTLQPRVLILAETEFWPNLLSGCFRREIPVAVVNARISDRSWPRYRRLRWLWRPFLEPLSRVLAQSESDAERLVDLGCLPERVTVAGNLKFDVRAAEPSEATRLLTALRHRLRLIVAGSTLEGEEAALIDAWPRLLAADPWLVLVLAPRHPERFEAVARLLDESNYSWKRRSDWRQQRAGAIKLLQPGQIVLLDSIGELASVYSLASVAFVGGSLFPTGGHNPLEPAQFGVPIVMGPNYANFRAITEDLLAREAIRIASIEGVGDALTELLRDRTAARTMGKRAREVFKQRAGATDRCVDALLRLLAPIQLESEPIEASIAQTEQLESRPDQPIQVPPKPPSESHPVNAGPHDPVQAIPPPFRPADFRLVHALTVAVEPAQAMGVPLTPKESKADESEGSATAPVQAIPALSGVAESIGVELELVEAEPIPATLTPPEPVESEPIPPSPVPSGHPEPEPAESERVPTEPIQAVQVLSAPDKPKSAQKAASRSFSARKLLFPLIPVYNIALRLRDKRLGTVREPIQRLRFPVVSIGNLSTGGAGKTPLTITLSRALSLGGLQVDVLSRGYGRRDRLTRRVSPGGTAEEFGDEPLVIAREAGVAVYVADRRYDAGRLAETDAAAIAVLGDEPKSLVHLLDDGFQHRQLHRDVDILLLNRQDWQDNLLPAGNLREPIGAARRAGVIAIPAEDAELEAELKDWGWQGPIWHLQRKMDVPPIEGAVFAFCGIARPEQFFSGLEAAGRHLAARTAFPDHHRYTASEVERLLANARSQGAVALFTTEKDLVRMGGLSSAFPEDLPLKTASLRVEIEQEDEAIDWLLGRLWLSPAQRSL